MTFMSSQVHERLRSGILQHPHTRKRAAQARRLQESLQKDYRNSLLHRYKLTCLLPRCTLMRTGTGMAGIITTHTQVRGMCILTRMATLKATRTRTRACPQTRLAHPQSPVNMHLAPSPATLVFTDTNALDLGLI